MSATRTVRLTRTRSTLRWPAKRGVLVILAGLLIVAGLSAGACKGSGPSASPAAAATPKSGGTYHYPLTADPVSIEPLNAQEPNGMQVAHQVFQGLVKYGLNDRGEMVAEPDIAASWETSDAQTWIFHLKKGVMFQPPVSREVVAQDFVDSWTRVTDPHNQSYVSYILAPVQGCDDGGYQVDPKAGLTGVRALDAHTLEVKLRYPFAELPQALGHPVAAVTPVDYIDTVGAKKYARKPVGTGAYLVRWWKQGVGVRLARNAAFWDKSAGGPYIDTIDMPIVPGPEAQWLEFQNGGLDYSAVPPGQVTAAAADPKVKSGEWSAKAWPTLAVYFVGMNMRDPALGQSLELRRALAESADVAAVVGGAGEGVPLAAAGYVPPGVPGYRPGQSPYAYDPAAAASLVGALGGAPPLTYWYDTDPGHRRVAEVLQAGWKQAGIAVKLSAFEWGTFLDKLSKGDEGGDSQLFRMGWIADYPSMDDVLYPLFQSDQAPTGSYTFYSSAQVDALLLQARATLDAPQRYDLYAQAERLILTEMPAVPVYHYRDFRVTDARVAGFTQDPMGLTDVWRLWVR